MKWIFNCMIRWKSKMIPCTKDLFHKWGIIIYRKSSQEVGKQKIQAQRRNFYNIETAGRAVKITPQVDFQPP